MNDDGIFVSNSYNRELHPVDFSVVHRVIKWRNSDAKKAYDNEFSTGCMSNLDNSYWSKRCETIYQLMLAGF